MQTIQTLIIITAGLFLMKVAIDTSYFLWLFQVKEYRLDRLRSHLREKVPVYPADLLLAVCILVLLSVLFPATAQFALVFLFLLAGYLAPIYFLLSVLGALHAAYKRSFRHPKPTGKLLLVAITYCLLYTLFVLGMSLDLRQRVIIVYSIDFWVILSAFLLLLDLLLPLFILLAILLVTPLSDFQKRRIVKRATAKMDGLGKVKTIGVTGSFGKTSTKEFLYAILSSKYKVVKTEGNNNTLMGVAGTVLREVSDDYDYFICEMGAYRRGEIEEICAVVHPEAGILTGINEQHLDLFGSLENTKRAKFELIESLPASGFAIISAAAAKMKPKLKYAVKDVALASVDLLSDLSAQPEMITFRYQDTSFSAHILGRHYALNLLLAIMAAEKLGMSREEISLAVEKMEIRSDFLMQKSAGPLGSVLIDDSYSANPSGVMAALDYLEEAYPKHKKIFVFPGIIELGKESEAVHQRLLERADNICSLIYIMQNENREMKKRYRKCRLVFGRDFDKIKLDLRKHLDSNTVVLFESRAAGVVRKKLLQTTKDK